MVAGKKIEMILRDGIDTGLEGLDLVSKGRVTLGVGVGWQHTVSMGKAGGLCSRRHP